MSAARAAPRTARTRRPATTRPATARSWLRPLGLAVVVVALTGLVGAGVLPDVDRLRGQVAAAGSTGWLVFAAAYVAATPTPLPKTPMTIAAGTMFGLVTGSVIVVVAATLGALIAFGIARLLGRDTVDRLTGPSLARAQDLVERHGFQTVLVARLVPVIPFTPLNFACGATRMGLADYAVGTALGIIPATVAYVALGRYGTDPGSWQFALSLAVLALLTLGGWIAARRRRGRTGALAPPAPAMSAPAPSEAAPSEADRGPHHAGDG